MASPAMFERGMYESRVAGIITAESAARGEKFNAKTTHTDMNFEFHLINEQFDELTKHSQSRALGNSFVPINVSS